MDWDDCAESHHNAESIAWFGRFSEVRGPRMAAWVSTFRNELSCGSFNWTCKVRFEDCLQWMVRFAVPGKVMNGDEKVRREVATMQFIRLETSIPIPFVIASGMSQDNPIRIGSLHYHGIHRGRATWQDPGSASWAWEWSNSKVRHHRQRSRHHLPLNSKYPPRTVRARLFSYLISI
jgi:hypothetical protein